MTSNNPNNNPITPNQPKIKKNLKLGSIISDDGKDEEHLGETFIVKKNSLTPRLTFFMV